MSGDSDIDRVREATDLVRLIGEHVALVPKGREHVGVCPFHDDHRPSMHVVTHKEQAFYKCFACGASGDCFRFVMEYHRMDFGEALRYLAERGGIALRQGERSERTASGPSRASLLEVTRQAHEFFRRNLADPVRGAAARAAIADRGIRPETAETFEMGLALPGYDNLLRTFQGDASRIATARAAGLLRTRPNDGGAYDTFRDRLVFPIFDELGRPIAFGGRVLDSADTPKYLNSPESPLFEKSRSLFGLHLAKREILDTGAAVVTEGYTDVTACHQAGFANVVGTLGTALTREHAEVLQRSCDTVILVFDGDEAGRRAADRAVEVFFAAPVDVRICALPDGLDPDDLLRAPDGAERFARALDGAQDALAYKLDRFTADLGDAAGLSGRQKRTEAFLAELARLGFGHLEGVRKRLVLTRLADLLRIPIGELERALPAQPRSRAAATSAPEPTPASPRLATSRALMLAERELLSVILFAPSVARQTLERDGSDLSALLEGSLFEDPVASDVAARCVPLLHDEESGMSMQRLLPLLPDDEARAVASQLYFDGQSRCDDDENAAPEALHNAAEVLRRCRERERHMRTATSVGGDAVDETQLLEQLQRRREQSYLPAAITRGARS